MVTYDSTFSIAAPSAHVWSALTDFARYGDWNPFLPSLVGDARVGGEISIALVLGDGAKPMNVSARILQLDPERCFAWQGNLGANFLFTGSREFALASLGPDATDVRHLESLTGLVAPVFHAVKRAGVAAHHHGFDACLKQRAEQLACS